MALFGEKETKEEKQLRKEQELLAKYGLENLNAKDLESVKKIVNDLSGLGLMKAGIALSFGNSAEQCKIGYLSAIVEQNWIMIRQLDRISKRLAKMDKE